MTKSDVNSKMGQLWKDGLLLDYTIEVADKQFKVHKVIMAAVSEYFKVMLTGGIANSQEDRVRLDIKDVSSLAVQNVIEFIYTGQFGSHKASTYELLTCARYLQIPAAIDACTTSTVSSDVGIAEGIRTLWEEDLLLDYTIKVENEQFKVHKVVIASSSDYFKAMLTGCMMESREDSVRLEGLSSHTIRRMIVFIYTGDFGLRKADVGQKGNARVVQTFMCVMRNMINYMYTGQSNSALVSLEDLLACAVYLQIPTAIKACTTSLCEQLDKHNCFRIQSTFKSFSVENSFEAEHTAKFIKQNIVPIMQVCDLKEPTYNDILLLFDIWNRSEWGLFLIIRKWLIAVSERMTEHVDDLMSRIRFCLMSPAEVTSIKGMEVFSKSEGPWKALVEKALIYHNLPTHQKVLYDSEQSRVRSDQTPVCIELQPSNCVLAMEGRSWVRRKTNDKPHFPYPFSPDIFWTQTNNFLIVCDSSCWCSQWYIYDPRNSTWSTMPSMDVPRTRFALVHHDQHLYVLGGQKRVKSQDKDCVILEHISTDRIERYDYKTNTWALMTSRMPTPMKFHNAFSVGNHIYITDVYTSNAHQIRDLLDCFDPNTGEWSHKDVHPLWRYSHRLCLELDGEMVMAGLTDDFKLLYYKPSVDQWFMYDSCPTSKPKFPDIGSCRLLSSGNTIFLLGFVQKDETNSDADGVAHTCEKWTLVTNQPTADVFDDLLTSEDGTTHFFVLLSHPCRRLLQ